MPEEIKTKKCSKCGKIKTVDNYYKLNKSKDGYRLSCKKCDKNKTISLLKLKEESLMKKGFIKCSKCGEIKELSSFYIRGDSNKEYRSHCIECLSNKGKEKRKKENHEKQKSIVPKGLKKCGKCKEVKPVQDYYKNKKSKDGFTWACKKCSGIISKKYAIENKCIIENNRKRYINNNRSNITKYNNNYNKERSKKDINFKIRLRYRRRILKAIKSQYGEKAYKTKELLGCDFQTVKEYLEKSFYNRKDGTPMSWELFLSSPDIHIDHIKPCASFDLTDPEQQKKCFHYTNLQFLWAEDNLKKGDKITEQI